MELFPTIESLLEHAQLLLQLCPVNLDHPHKLLKAGVFCMKAFDLHCNGSHQALGTRVFCDAFQQCNLSVNC